MKNFFLILFLLILLSNISKAEEGYYRSPSIYNATIVFTAEGDLWKVSEKGGDAHRLTTHHGLEINADVSPDGKFIAFNGQYDGPFEIYIIPINGGIPKRITYEGAAIGRYNPIVYGWTNEGQLIYSTIKYSSLPNAQLVKVDPNTLIEQLVPLHQANEGVYETTGNTLFFTRLSPQSSQTRRYQGGTAENIWKFTKGTEEAIPLTADFAGTSRQPMWYNGRIYFVTDVEGTLNIWSMNTDGQDRKQHTFSKGWDIQTPDIYHNKLVYQKGADLYTYSITNNQESKVNINLISDFDQRRVKWVTNPNSTISHADMSPDGKKIVLAARGRVFVTPTDGSRWAEITRKSGVRYQNAEFMDSTNIAFLSDESGEMEVWKTQADGLTELAQITTENNITILSTKISADGKWMLYTDKNDALILVNMEDKTKRTINDSTYWGWVRFVSIGFSPDSKWITYSMADPNQTFRIHLYEINTGKDHTITTDRLDSYLATWSKDSKWLYFLSDREFSTIVNSPWGPRQPEPFFNKTTKLYALALYEDERFPFLPDDELKIDKKQDENESEELNKGKKKKADEPKEEIKPIVINGLMQRLYEVPLKGKNFAHIDISEEHIYWSENEMPHESSQKLYALEISSKKKNEPTLVAEGLKYFQLSDDKKKILIHTEDGLYVVDAKGNNVDLSNSKVTLQEWSFQINPVEDWRQLMVDAWRLERDYFWDPNMLNVDWNKELERHLPLVDRVTDRHELNNLIAHMVAELSTLHTVVRGGENREPTVTIAAGSLGAKLVKNETMGGYEIEYIYQSDP
ncbi:MAG: PD40 domain-containing protein, partial [Cyclobacteriaceae bacterium]|nr:PD40 domain-containing protein [Cyclobacteriaceae bacterium]